MKIKPFFFMVLILFGFSAAVCAQDPEKSFESMMSQGDPEAGKTAFRSLGCVECHRVAEADDLPLPVTDAGAPTFGYLQSRYSVEWLITSIVSPSHSISSDRFIPVSHLNQPGSSPWIEKGETSQMKDFTNVMTVRQLVDIIAYLKSDHSA